MTKPTNNSTTIFKLIALVIVLLGAAVSWGYLARDVKYNTKHVEEITKNDADQNIEIAVLKVQQLAIYKGVNKLVERMDKTD